MPEDLQGRFATGDFKANRVKIFSLSDDGAGFKLKWEEPLLRSSHRNFRPVDVNGINKLAGEQYHQLYCKVYDIHTSVLRLTNTFGPRMRIKDARQTFIGIWIRLLLEGKRFEVWGGEQLRDFTFVDDCIQALAMAAVEPKAKGEIFNVGGTEPLSLIQLAEELIEANGEGEYEIKAFPFERKRIDIGNYYSCDASIRNTLGWSHKTPLKTAIKTTLDYYRANLDRYL